MDSLTKQEKKICGNGQNAQNKIKFKLGIAENNGKHYQQIQNHIRFCTNKQELIYWQQLFLRYQEYATQKVSNNISQMAAAKKTDDQIQKELLEEYFKQNCKKQIQFESDITEDIIEDLKKEIDLFKKNVSEFSQNQKNMENFKLELSKIKNPLIQENISSKIFSQQQQNSMPQISINQSNTISSSEKKKCTFPPQAEVQSYINTSTQVLPQKFMDYDQIMSSQSSMKTHQTDHQKNYQYNQLNSQKFWTSQSNQQNQTNNSNILIDKEKYMNVNDANIDKNISTNVTRTYDKQQVRPQKEPRYQLESRYQKETRPLEDEQNYIAHQNTNNNANQTQRITAQQNDGNNRFPICSNNTFNQLNNIHQKQLKNQQINQTQLNLHYQNQIGSQYELNTPYNMQLQQWQYMQEPIDFYSFSTAGDTHLSLNNQQTVTNQQIINQDHYLSSTQNYPFRSEQYSIQDIDSVQMDNSNQLQQNPNQVISDRQYFQDFQIEETNNSQMINNNFNDDMNDNNNDNYNYNNTLNLYPQSNQYIDTNIIEAEDQSNEIHNYSQNLCPHYHPIVNLNNNVQDSDFQYHTNINEEAFP